MSGECVQKLQEYVPLETERARPPCRALCFSVSSLLHSLLLA